MMAWRTDVGGPFSQWPVRSISGTGQPVDADDTAGGAAPKRNELLKIECPRGYYSFIR